MFKKTLLSLALASSLFATGCGGGGGGSDSSSSGGGSTPARSTVAGPLDAVQTPVSQQVIAPLTAATAGTPIAGVSECVNQLVVSDLLDTGDVIANGLQNGATSMDVQGAITGTAAGVQAQLLDVATNLQGLLTALAGGAGCNGSTTGIGTSNPLAGTPLAALGDQLEPVLAQIQAAAAGGSASPASLGDLSGLYFQLDQALQSALGSIPPEAQGAPVVGGLISTLSDAFNNLGFTLAAASGAATSGDPTATQAALATTVNDLLSGVLLDVVPVNELEVASGQTGAISGPLQTAIDQLTAALQTGSVSGDPTGLSTTLTDTIATVLAPLTGAASGSDPTVVLTTLLDQFTAALGGSAPGSIPTITGVPGFDTGLQQLTELLSGAGSMGNPLTSLVDTLTGLLGGLLGG